jgi:hypothetical protein
MQVINVEELERQGMMPSKKVVSIRGSLPKDWHRVKPESVSTGTN